MDWFEEELNRLRERMRKAFEFEFKFPRLELKEFRAPLADIRETKENVIVTIELPGIAKEDIIIEISGNILVVKAEKKAKEEVKKEGFYKFERSYKGFYRQLALPAFVNAEKATTEYKDGILKVTMPKIKEALVKKRLKIR